MFYKRINGRGHLKNEIRIFGSTGTVCTGSDQKSTIAQIQWNAGAIAAKTNIGEVKNALPLTVANEKKLHNMMNKEKIILMLVIVLRFYLFRQL
jgi:hypothetical protein